MTDTFPDVLVRRPSEEERLAAVAALHRQTKANGTLCGCYVALCRNPFYSGLEAHWHTYHPQSLAVLRDSQARRLADLAQEASALNSIPRIS
jgi:hypothetical protein